MKKEMQYSAIIIDYHSSFILDLINLHNSTSVRDTMDIHKVVVHDVMHIK